MRSPNVPVLIDPIFDEFEEDQHHSNENLEEGPQPIIHQNGVKVDEALIEQQRLKLKNQEEALINGQADIELIQEILTESKTKCLVLKKTVVYMYHGEIKIYGKRSLFVFRGDNIVRKACAWLIDWDPFEYFILGIIALNSITLAMYNYEDRDSETKYNQVLDLLGFAFSIIFMVEAVVEIIAKGFILHQQAYLRTGWGILDFTVVVSGLVELFIARVRLKALRVLRALRPLKSITVIPSMKKLVSALLQTLPEFANVGMFLVYVFLLFAILGVHLYNGIFYNACRFSPKPESDTEWHIDDSVNRMCSKTGAGVFQCPSTQFCGNPAEYGISLSNENAIDKGYMYYGIHSFDNIFTSLQIVFQIVTAESWSTYMYNLMDVDTPFIAGLYCLMIVGLGSLFLMNLILTVVIQTFINITKKELIEEVKRINDEAQGKQSLATAQIIMNQILKEENSSIEDGPEEFSPKKITRKQPKQELGASDNNILVLKKNFSEQQRRTSSFRQRAQYKALADHSMEAAVTPQDLIQGFDEDSLQERPNIFKMRQQPDFLNSPQVPPANILDSSRPLTQQQIQQDSLQLQDETSKIYETPPAEDEEEKQQIENELAFIKDRGMQRKVVGIFNSKRNEDKHLVIRAKEVDNTEEIFAGRFSSQFNRLQKQSTIPQYNSMFKVNFQSYIKQQIVQEQNEINFYNKMIEDEQNKPNSKERRKSVDKQNPTLRDLTGMRIKISLKRSQGNLNKHYMKFRIEYRAQKSIIYFAAYSIIQSQIFMWAVSLSIVINTIILGLDRYPNTRDDTVILDNFNIGFTIFFIIEAILKLIGMGIKGYLDDNYNIFDSLIVIASIIDIFVSFLLKTKGVVVITILRSCRLIRIFKLAKQWKRLDYLLQTIGRTLKDVANFSVLMMLFMFSFALFGMELYGYKVKYTADDKMDLTLGEPPANNFDTLYSSLTTVFVVLTGDGWSGIYFQHYRALPNAVSTIFFTLLIIIGQKVLLNLFLAILLQNFDESNLREHIQNELNNKLENQQSLFEKVMAQVGTFKAWISLKLFRDQNSDQKSQSQTDINKAVVIHNKQEAQNNQSQVVVNKQTLSIEGTSLWIFKHDHKLRQAFFNIVQSQQFEYFITIVILVSSVQLALDRPNLDPASQYDKVLYIIDVLTTMFFALEATLKILALGFFLNGKQSYLRQTWNILDFAILLLSFSSLSPLTGNLQIFKMFRILRILRLISKNDRLKVGVQAMMYAIPSILNVTIIILFFFMIFGIICVSYFKGTLFYCSFDHLNLDELSYTNKWSCIDLGGEWINKVSNFDNLYQAITALFIMSTGTWAELMYQCVSATQIDAAPVKINNPYWIIFFIIYIIVASFFLMNLFVGVVISTFNSESDKIGGYNLLTDQQKEWLDSKTLVLQSTPLKKQRPPAHKFRRFFYLIQFHPKYETFILVCIVLNTVILSFKWYMQPAYMDNIQDIVNYTFVAIFTFEAFCKMISYSVKEYFLNDGWNQFDFLVLLASYAGIFLSLTSTLVSLKGAITIVRAFRILRIIRLVKRAKSLNLIFNTFIVSLPALFNVGGLLLLILYLYSILGMQLFGQVMRSGIYSQSLNFETFSNAFGTLWAVATGDSWDEIMFASLRQYSLQFQCLPFPTYEDYVSNDNQNVGCGPGGIGVVYFYTFYMFVNLIFLNLFIAIILQGFIDIQVKDQRLFNQDTLTHFRNVWADYDPDATSFIQISHFRDFLLDLGTPLGFDPEDIGNDAEEKKFIATLQLPTYDELSTYHYKDVLEALSLRMMILDHLHQKRQRRGNTEKEKAEGDEVDSKQSAVDEESEIEEDQQYANSDEEQEAIRDQIQQDINKLLLREGSENIQMFKELKLQEQNSTPSQHLAKRDMELTSAHVAAAEWSFNRMKRFVKLQKKARQQKQLLHVEKLKELQTTYLSDPKTQQKVVNEEKVQLEQQIEVIAHSENIDIPIENPKNDEIISKAISQVQEESKTSQNDQIQNSVMLCENSQQYSNEIQDLELVNTCQAQVDNQVQIHHQQETFRFIGQNNEMNSMFYNNEKSSCGSVTPTNNKYAMQARLMEFKQGKYITKSNNNSVFENVSDKSSIRQLQVLELQDNIYLSSSDDEPLYKKQQFRSKSPLVISSQGKLILNASSSVLERNKNKQFNNTSDFK